jgi:hypothetical protein
VRRVRHAGARHPVRAQLLQERALTRSLSAYPRRSSVGAPMTNRALRST